MPRQTRGPVTWFGGKARLRTQIIPLLPDHKCYVEPFCGGAWVFFGKERAKQEVLNDVNGELTRFYRVLANHPGAVLDELAEVIVGRREFYELQQADLDRLTDVQRAARFFCLQRLCYAGMPAPGGRYFSPGSNKAWNMTRREFDQDIAEAHERLRHALIENLDWERCLSLYDGADTLFYVDPPYIEVSNAYGFAFSNDDQRRLAEALNALRGTFVLSINDHPLARELYAQCHLKAVTTKYATMARGGKQRDVGELIILGPLGRAWPPKGASKRRRR